MIFRRSQPCRGVFAEFAAGSLGGRVHDALVKEYLAEELVGHISRDSTAIVWREKPAKKKKAPKKPRKREWPAKGEQREPAVEKRLDRQVHQSAEEAFQAALGKCRCKSSLWEVFRRFFRNFIAPSVEYILRAIGQGLKNRVYQVALE